MPSRGPRRAAQNRRGALARCPGALLWWPERMAPLLLVDYSSLLYRAFHSLPSSVPAQGVHGFLNMLARLVADRRPGALAIAVDDDWRPEFRVATLPSYKAHRVACPGDEPDPVTPQEELGRQVLLAMGLAVIGAGGFGAEDVSGR